MRSRARQFAHLLERCGLAVMGAAGGLFVGAHVGSSIDVLTTFYFLIATMLAGAAGAYLGIDTPPHPFHALNADLPGELHLGKIDLAELLTAVGTLLAATTAFASVALIVFVTEAHVAGTIAVSVVWLAGVLMQIGAGTIARMRA